MNTSLNEIWEQCEATGDYGPLSRRLRDGMNRACHAGNPLDSTIEEIREKNLFIDQRSADGKLEEAIHVAEELAELAEHEYGGRSREYGLQLEKLANLYQRADQVQKSWKCMDEALFVLAIAASADGDRELAEQYWERWRKLDLQDSDTQHAADEVNANPEQAPGVFRSRTWGPMDDPAAPRNDRRLLRQLSAKRIWVPVATLTAAATILFLLMNFAFQTSTQVVAQFDDVNRTIRRYVDGRVEGHEVGDAIIDRDVAEAVSTGRLEVPAETWELARSSFGVITRAADKRWARPQMPVGEAIDNPTPTFHWSEDDAGSWYRIFIYNDDLEPVTVSPPLRETSWTLPEEERLAWGATFYWEVSVHETDELHYPDLDTPKAAFRVLSAEEVFELGQALSAASESHIARAVILAKFGLVSDALAELNELEKLNPESSLISNMANDLQKKRLQ